MLNTLPQDLVENILAWLPDDSFPCHQRNLTSVFTEDVKS